MPSATIAARVSAAGPTRTSTRSPSPARSTLARATAALCVLQLEGDEGTVGRQGTGQPDGAVAAEGADLEHPAGAGDAHQQGQQLPLVGRHVDRRGGRRRCCRPARHRGRGRARAGWWSGGRRPWSRARRPCRHCPRRPPLGPPLRSGAVRPPDGRRRPERGGRGRSGSGSDRRHRTVVAGPGARNTSFPTVSDMLRDEFLRSIPKTELHCHIEGSVRAADLRRPGQEARHLAAHRRGRRALRLRDDLRVPGDLRARLVDPHRPGRLRPRRLRGDGGRPPPRQPPLPGDVLQPHPAHPARRADEDHRRRAGRGPRTRPRTTSA